MDNEHGRQRRRVKALLQQAKPNTENQQQTDLDTRSATEQAAPAQRQPCLTYKERKALGICRDCDEPSVGGTIMCEVHGTRMREYRKQYKAKKRDQAKGG